MLKAKAPLSFLALFPFALAACTAAPTQPEHNATSTRVEPSTPSYVEVKRCLTDPSGKPLPKVPKNVRLYFTSEADTAGLARNVKVKKGNFRFKKFAPCLEKELTGLPFPSAEGNLPQELLLQLGKENPAPVPGATGNQ